MYRRPLLHRLAPASVVVFRARQLGDMLCAVPALRALRTALPQARIALVGLPWAQQFAARFPGYVDEFLPFPGHPLLRDQPVRHAALADFYGGLAARRFDLAIQLHDSGEAGGGGGGGDGGKIGGKIGNKRANGGDVGDGRNNGNVAGEGSANDAGGGGSGGSGGGGGGGGSGVGGGIDGGSGASVSENVGNDIVSGFGAGATAGFCRGAPVARARTVLFTYPATGTEPERLLHLVGQLGAAAAVAAGGVQLEFPVSRQDEDELAASGVARGLAPGSYVCIHPGARRREKCWPARHFADLGDRLAAEFGVRIVLTGSAQEADITAAVAAHMHAPAIDATAPMSIGAMAALMRDARLLLCNDTGVSHIAAGLKLKSVVIFNQADIARRAPLDRHTHRCIWDPGAERTAVVLQHARALLADTAPSRQRMVGMWPYW